MAPSNQVVPVDDVTRPNYHSKFWSLKSVRFQMALLLCLTVGVQWLMRTNLGMAMVCMVNSTMLGYPSNLHQQENGTNHSHKFNSNETSCHYLTPTHTEYDGHLPWDAHVQAILFSAMFWGGFFSAIPAGFLADRYGPRVILLLSTALHTIGTLLIPYSASHFGFFAVFLARFLVGLGSGLTMPAVAAVVARWFPAGEKSSVVAIHTTGFQLAFLSNPLGAFLCQQKQLLGGWPSIFYICGGVSLLWYPIWTSLATNTPENCRRMGEREKSYLREAFRLQPKRKVATNQTPWRKIFTSMPVLANVFANTAATVFLTLFQAYLPTYFKTVLALDLKNNGIFSALPYILQWLVKMVISPLSDYLVKRRNCNPTIVCKVFNSIATFGTGICILGVSFFDCNNVGYAVGLLTLANCCFAGFIPGVLTSLVTIAPPFSGTITSMGRFFGLSASIITPYVVGWVAKDGTADEWRLIFIGVSVVHFIAGVFFLLFGSCKVQPWAELSSDDSKDGKQKAKE